MGKFRLKSNTDSEFSVEVLNFCDEILKLSEA